MQFPLRRVCVLLGFINFATAVNVYLSPQNDNGRGRVTAQEASRVVSQHLGVEMFEPMSTKPLKVNEDSTDFVGLGQKSSLLISMEATDLQAVFPAYKPSLRFGTDQPPSHFDMSEVVSEYAARARQLFSVVDEVQFSTRQLLNSESIPSIPPSSAVFAAIDLSSVSSIRDTYGGSSGEYQDVVTSLRSYITDALDRKDDIQLVILAYTPPNTPSKAKRQAGIQSQFPLPPDHAPPQSPIGGISTCFQTEDICTNSTDSCSGRGQCVKATKEGVSCFECTCAATKTGEGNKVKTKYWVGESCEREDVSSQFVLFVGITLLLLFIVTGSVGLLYTVGDIPLPSTLLSSATPSKRD